MEGIKFKHSQHIEDTVFSDVQSIENSIDTLDKLKNQFGTENEDNDKIVQGKLDGSPSCFLISTSDGRFGVSTKAIFNKTPVCCWNLDEIDEKFGAKSADLATKLKYAWTYMQDITPVGAFQADFLYIDTDLKEISYEGVNYLGWQPNTILYTVETDSELGKFIATSKMGIYVHSHYTWDGQDLKTLEVKDFSVKEKEFGLSDEVFLCGSNQIDIGSAVAFSDNEESKYERFKNSLENLIPEIDFAFLQKYEDLLLMFTNSLVKQNKQFADSMTMDELIVFTDEQRKKDLSKVKNGDKVNKKYDDIMTDFDNNEDKLQVFFGAYIDLYYMKKLVVDHLNNVQQKAKSFLVKKSDGSLVPTTPEGFVICSGPAFSKKLVDRYNFSQANFSPEYKKGFEH